jgi:hypothetical protein
MSQYPAPPAARMESKTAFWRLAFWLVVCNYLEPCGEIGFGILVIFGVEGICVDGSCGRGALKKSLDYIYGLSIKSVMYS